MATEVPNADVLQKERLYFESHRAELLEKHENLSALIKGGAHRNFPGCGVSLQ